MFGRWRKLACEKDPTLPKNWQGRAAGRIDSSDATYLNAILRVIGHLPDAWIPKGKMRWNFIGRIPRSVQR